MKKSKLPENTAKNASKMHIYVGSLLRELFPHYEVRQEYMVSAVNEGFKSNRERFDWVVLGLNVAVEIHGLQHYMPCCFGGIELRAAKVNFRKQQERDQAKKEAALEAGWAYLVVRFNETKITYQELSERITQALEEVPREKKVKPNGPKQKPKYKRPIPGRPMQNRATYDWPTKKIPSRPFPRREE